MFKSLRTSTKLLLLCGVFVAALVVATYGLVAEKQIAIHFVRKELVGVQHLELLRGVYAAILKENVAASPGAGEKNAAREKLDKLAATQVKEPEQLDTAALERALREAIDKLASAPDDGAEASSPPSRRSRRRAISHRGSATTPILRSIRISTVTTSRTSSSPRYRPSLARSGS